MHTDQSFSQILVAPRDIYMAVVFAEVARQWEQHVYRGILSGQFFLFNLVSETSVDGRSRGSSEVYSNIYSLRINRHLSARLRDCYFLSL